MYFRAETVLWLLDIYQSSGRMLARLCDVCIAYAKLSRKIMFVIAIPSLPSERNLQSPIESQSANILFALVGIFLVKEILLKMATDSLRNQNMFCGTIWYQ